MTEVAFESSIKNTILYDTIKLLAFATKIDGTVTINEKLFIKDLFKRKFSSGISDELYIIYNRLLNDKISLKSLINELNNRLNKNEKFFLVLKVAELTLVDGLSDDEMLFIKNISKEFLIEPSDILFVIKILKESVVDYSLGSSIKVVKINDKINDSDLFIKIENLQVFFFSYGRKVYIISKTEINNEVNIRINDKLIYNNEVFEFEKNSHISINNYTFQFDDIKYFFRNLNKELQVSFVRINQDVNKIEIVDDINAADFFIKKDKCKIYIKPNKTTNIYLNDIKIKNTFCEVYLYDIVEIKPLKFSLRNAMQEIPEYSTEYKTDLHFSLTIGNNFTNDFYIEDNAKSFWQSQLITITNGFLLKKKSCPFKIYVNSKEAFSSCKCNLDDEIRILDYKITFNKNQRRFESQKICFSTLVCKDLSYRFPDRTPAIDNVTFAVKRNELIGVIGPSGCGKSTILSILIGSLKPEKGEVLIDGINLHDNYSYFKDKISIVPQDDLLFDNLTVYENLYYNALLRNDKKNIDIKYLVNNVLHLIGLYDKRNCLVGNPENKVLSGGERKRLNIGLELLSDSHFIFLDEPTSGLSSNDAESIMNLLKQISLKDKFVFVVIHQPSNRLFNLFNNILVLDKGGKLVFFGTPELTLEYFKKYDINRDQINSSELTSSDYIFNILEQPFFDINNNYLPIRRYSPDFWKNEYLNNNQNNSNYYNLDNKATVQSVNSSSGIRNVFITLLKRSFINKLRDKSNIAVSFILPPILAFFTAFILKYTPSDEYTLYENRHFFTFIFLSVLISIFFGITNSVEEIIKDQRIITREKLLNISIFKYYFSKFLSLIPFALFQNVIYIFIGFAILRVKEFHFEYIVYLTLTSMCGIAIGLFISSLPKLSLKAAINIIPLLLVPQIIFGGALIKFEEMNKQLTFYENSAIPEICHVMPSRWSFEALLTYQGYYNKYHKKSNDIQEELNAFKIDKANMMYHNTEIDSVKLSKVEVKIDSLEQMLSYHNDKFKDNFGNGDINAAIKFSNMQTKNDSFLSQHKKIPFLNFAIHTHTYNAFVLFLIIITFAILSIIILKFRFN